MASGFHFDRGQIEVALGEFDLRVHAGVTATVEFIASKSEGELKTRAPWTDRTTAARSGLHTVADAQLAAWTIVLAHSVNYGIWLETKNNGEYAVILKVLVDAGNQLMALLEGLFGRI